MNVSDVMIAVPTRGNPDYLTVEQLQSIRDANPSLRPIAYVQGHISVVLTRNTALDRFLASDARVLVMVDDDCVPHEAFLDALPAFERYGVIGWPSPIMRQPWQWNFLPEGDDPGPVVPCVHVGTAVIGIRRDVAEAVRFRDAKDSRIPSPGSDCLFCWNARDAGFEVGCDLAHPADHIQRMSSFDAMYGLAGGEHGLFDVAVPMRATDDLEELKAKHRVREPVVPA